MSQAMLLPAFVALIGVIAALLLLGFAPTPVAPVDPVDVARDDGDWDDGTFVDDDEYVEYVVSWDDQVAEPANEESAPTGEPDSASAHPEWRNILDLLLEEPPPGSEPTTYADNGFHEDDQPSARAGRHAREPD